MTGREYVMYILQNGLENEQIFQDGKLIGFMTVGEAAMKFDVGPETIILWVKMNMLKGVYIGNVLYIPATAKDPREALCSK